MNPDLTYDGRIPMEITDMFMNQAKHDALIARAARIAGAEQMRLIVLAWAYSFRSALSPEMRGSLIEAMEQRLDSTQRHESAAPEQAEGGR